MLWGWAELASYFGSTVEVRAMWVHERRRGTYPLAVLFRRRQLHLPTTPPEHTAYDQCEPPRMTRAQRDAILHDVLPRCAPAFAAILRQIASRIPVVRDPGEEG
jgi:hypothetical protein